MPDRKLHTLHRKTSHTPGRKRYTSDTHSRKLKGTWCFKSTPEDFSQQHFPLEDSNSRQAVLQREKPSSQLPPSEVASHTAIHKDGQHTSRDARQAFGDLRGESDPLKLSRETEEKFFISASEKVKNSMNPGKQEDIKNTAI